MLAWVSGCARRARGAIQWESMAGMREVLQCCSDVQVGEDDVQVGERWDVRGVGGGGRGQEDGSASARGVRGRPVWRVEWLL